MNQAVAQTLARELSGPLALYRAGASSAEVLLHRRYNPEGITRYNIVPGLLGIILTMTMVMMTALAVTRERERGTMENLLAMPVRPIEVMAGKIAPYIVIGGMQVAGGAGGGEAPVRRALRGQLRRCSAWRRCSSSPSTWRIGFTFSTIAQNQLQAMQMSFFFLMPSILLSGFAFPFRGMPGWAQVIGEVLPVTHFLRIVRGLMLKAASPGQMANEITVIVFVLVIIATVAHQPLPRDPGLN